MKRETEASKKIVREPARKICPVEYKYLRTTSNVLKNGNEIDKLDLLQFKKYASKKVNIDETFTKDKIEKMPYSTLKKNWLTNLLKQHLDEYGNDPKLAFKGEALEMLYKKAPHPINKVTRKEVLINACITI